MLGRTDGQTHVQLTTAGHALHQLGGHRGVVWGAGRGARGGPAVGRVGGQLGVGTGLGLGALAALREVGAS